MAVMTHPASRLGHILLTGTILLAASDFAAAPALASEGGFGNGDRAPDAHRLICTARASWSR